MRNGFSFAGACLVVLAQSVSAQPPTTSWALLDAACQGSGNQVQLHAFDAGEHPELVGFHFYRRAAGDCARVRVTETPVVRIPNTSTIYTVTDPGVPAAIAQGYSMTAVDEDGNEVDGYQLFTLPNSNLHDIASCDGAYLGTGTLQDDGWALSFDPCPSTCVEFYYAEHFPPALRDLADTGTVVRLYGTFHCGSVEGCLAQVTSYEITACTVGVERQVWGDVKRRYQ